MKLSVCCITYNHEAFIVKALDGMLMQQTNFPFEIVIGEDGSKDKTRRICEAYQRKYPDKIRLLPNEGNLGMIPNFTRTLDACAGEYTAICEGDDYWTDDQKLQRQVDFLDGHPSYAICYHAVDELFSGQPVKPYSPNAGKQGNDYSIEDLAKGNFISTPSVVFRSHLFTKYPEWFSQSPVGDYVLHMLNAKYGMIRYMPEAMAVYRRHAEGAWGLKKAEDNSLRFIKVIELLESEFNGAVRDILVKQKAGIYSQLATIKFYDRDVEKGKAYAEKAFSIDGSLKDRWLKEDYPNLISNIFNSRRYKAADKLAGYLSKLSK